MALVRYSVATAVVWLAIDHAQLVGKISCIDQLTGHPLCRNANKTVNLEIASPINDQI